MIDGIPKLPPMGPRPWIRFAFYITWFVCGAGLCWALKPPTEVIERRVNVPVIQENADTCAGMCGTAGVAFFCQIRDYQFQCVCHGDPSLVDVHLGICSFED